MKDNLNIEELFKEKFNSFEGDVSPDAWANIQQGMNVTSATTAAKTGMSTFLKTAIFSGGIIAATITGVYLLSDDQKNLEDVADKTVADIEVVDPIVKTDLPEETIIQVMDDNDPVIEERRAEIEREIQDDKVEQSNNENENGNTEDDSDNLNELEALLLNDEAGANDENSSTNIETPEAVNSEDVSQENQATDLVIDEAQLNDKKDFPTGKMSFNPGDQYAPSTYSFEANAVNYTQVVWDFGDGIVGNGEHVEHTFEKPGKYTVRMTVIGKEDVYEETQIITIQTKSSIDNIPNVITPNNDRINDYFAINTTEIETFFIEIRDKNGNVVFESTEKDFKWDGTDKSSTTLEKGRCTYMIFAKGFDGSEFKIPGQIYIE